MSNNILNNSVFTLEKLPHPRPEAVSSFYYISLQPRASATQAEVDVLSRALATICNNASEKSAVILDCSQLRTVEIVDRFLQLDLSRAIGVGQQGLDKFVIVTHNKCLTGFSNTIIKRKHAGSYTKICASLDEALRML